MTTGDITVGAVNSNFYSRKYWSGSDGKFDGFGRLKTNPYLRVQHEIRQSIEPCYGRKYLEEWHPGCTTPTCVEWTDNDTINLYNKLSDQIRGHTFNLGVAVGQGRETLDLAVATVHRFRGSIRALKKGDISSAVRYLGLASAHVRSVSKPIRRRAATHRRLDMHDVSAAWLELQYGWRPLIQDVYEASKAYERVSSPPRRTKISASITKSGSLSIPYNDSYPWVYYSTEASQTISKKITMYVVEDVSLSQSLGLVDPVSVAWELVPFSFVVDWFIPIGSYFESKSLLPNLNATYFLNYKYWYKGSCVGNPNPNWSWNPVAYQCASNDRRDYRGSRAEGTYFVLSRSIPPSLSFPLPVFEPINSALSTGRLKNALALLHQVVVPQSEWKHF